VAQYRKSEYHRASCAITEPLGFGLVAGSSAWACFTLAKERLMAHKFKVRQIVRLIRSSYSDTRLSASDTYEIVRLMPADQTGEPSYRIKSDAGERAVRESEITAV
jgi:hypothetical protein